jgi:hypothetical protein
MKGNALALRLPGAARAPRRLSFSLTHVDKCSRMGAVFARGFLTQLLSPQELVMSTLLHVYPGVDVEAMCHYTLAGRGGEAW